MKALAVLNGDGHEIETRAADMVPLWSSLAEAVSDVELWMIHSTPVPDRFPEWPVPLSRVYRIPMPETGVPDLLLDLISARADSVSKDLYLFDGTDFGNCLATRLGFRLKGSICLHAQSCRMDPENAQLKADRLVYGSHLLARLTLDTPPWCLSAAATAGKTLKWTDDPGCPVTDLPETEIPKPSWITASWMVPLETDDSLAGADRILVLGNGVGSRRTIERLMPVAQALGAELGATRPVIMNGWLPMDRLIGVSGAMTAPSLCIVAGASGTGAFCAGIRQAEWIVAINSDADAPVFQAADVGIVDDLVPILLALGELLEKQDLS